MRVRIRVRPCPRVMTQLGNDPVRVSVRVEESMQISEGLGLASGL